jgi:hypothetical protein
MQSDHDWFVIALSVAAPVLVWIGVAIALVLLDQRRRNTMIPYEPRELTVYVPRAGAELGIAPGSAIVGELADDGRVLIHYEGNLYGGHPRFEDRLLHAHGRHVVQYPTVARSLVAPHEIVAVGSYAPDRDPKFVIDEPQLLDAWMEASGDGS